jgi:hypothetical protein
LPSNTAEGFGLKRVRTGFGHALKFVVLRPDMVVTIAALDRRDLKPNGFTDPITPSPAPTTNT